MKWNGLWILLAAFCLVACGDGSFDIQRDNTDSSLVDLRGEPDISTPDTEAKQYYEDNLFSIIATDGTNWATDSTAKGCLGTGCHSLQTSAPTFFQQDATNFELSWNYARVRRQLILYGTYAPEPPSSAKTLKNRNLGGDGELLPQTQRHQSFRNWSEDDFALIDAWTDLPAE